VLHEKAAYNVSVLTEDGEQQQQQEQQLTIEELAARTGMTVRNIRAHQSRGLLPPPEIHGRTGFYGPEHVTRLELISEMQADGFNLQAIKRLIDVSDGSGQELLGFSRALMAPFEQESPEFIEQAELDERWGRLDPKLIAKAERLGLIRPLGAGRFEVPSPTLLRAGEELLALGVQPRTMLNLAELIVRRTESISEAFIELFLEAVWKPFAAAGRPDEDWPRIREALERLRPLASEAVLATFQRTMTQGVERALGRQLERG
jgi:DNA-binding transcriptional MerR regulator